MHRKAFGLFEKGQGAARFIVIHSNPVASADLVRQLADPDPNVRRTALDLLSRIIEVAPADLSAASGPK